VSPPLTIVWFRQDLRLDDNPALARAAERGAVLPVFIDTTAYQKTWRAGEARRWWLGRSLASLDLALRERGSRLIVARGDGLTVLSSLARRCKADAVFWNRRYEPTATVHDARVQRALREVGHEVVSFNGRLLRRLTPGHTRE
jgi:deoxyribodipyrimidine photo-lyase